MLNPISSQRRNRVALAVIIGAVAVGAAMVLSSSARAITIPGKTGTSSPSTTGSTGSTGAPIVVIGGAAAPTSPPPPGN